MIIFVFTPGQISKSSSTSHVVSPFSGNYSRAKVRMCQAHSGETIGAHCAVRHVLANDTVETSRPRCLRCMLSERFP